MNRRTVLGTATASTLAALGGCLGSLSGGGSSGTLATRVSDRPGDIEDFEQCVVTVRSVDVLPSDADEPTTLDVEDGDVDLTVVKGKQSALVDEAELDAGSYDWLRVNLTGSVDATLADGGSATVEVPSNGLKLNEAFDIRAETRTTFTADFTPVKRGKTSTYNIQPVTNEVTVSYDDEGDTTGTAGG